MELIKGKVYSVSSRYDWTLHNRAEYHSTSKRECDLEPLHNMIIRMYGGNLEMAIFTSDEIISEVEEPV